MHSFISFSRTLPITNHVVDGCDGSLSDARPPTTPPDRMTAAKFRIGNPIAIASLVPVNGALPTTCPIWRNARTQEGSDFPSPFEINCKSRTTFLEASRFEFHVTSHRSIALANRASVSRARFRNNSKNGREASQDVGSVNGVTTFIIKSFFARVIPLSSELHSFT